MRTNVILTPFQKRNIEQKIKQARFDRLTKTILENKRLNADQKARQIVELKNVLFGRG